jgi:hypothetical protein
MSEILPQQREELERLNTLAKAGAILWSEVQEYQASIVPLCANHTDQPRPMSAYQNKTPLCADCYVALVKARKQKSNAQT